MGCHTVLYQYLLQFSVPALMWRSYSDRDVSLSGPPRRPVDICCLWGPVTRNYRLNQVLPASFLSPLSLPYSSPLPPHPPFRHITHSFSPLFSLTFLFSLSHPHHTSPPLLSCPASRSNKVTKEWIQHPVPESYLNSGYVSRPAAELYQSPRGSRDHRRKCRI